MNLNIQSIHFDADTKLLEFIQKKVNKLETFNDRIINGEVFLKLDKSETKENKITEIKVQIPGSTLFSKETCKSFEEGTDLAVESLRRQLAKAKARK